MKRYSGKLKFIVSHFTVLILAVLVFAAISWQVNAYVTEEMAKKQNLVMNQAMKATDAEIAKVLRKAIDISADEYVQWFYYIEEPLNSRDLFYTVKLVKNLKRFYEEHPLIVDYYVYFGSSGRIANANSFYKKEDFYNLIWSYENMTVHEWETEVLNNSQSGVFIGEQVMYRDSARKELLTYVYPLEKNNADSNTKVVLLLDKEYISDYISSGLQHGMVEITDAAGRHILDCKITDELSGELPVYMEDGWAIIDSQDGRLLVNRIRSEQTGWVYTAGMPMNYVTENVVWLNRLLISGLLLMMVLGSPLCFYWAKRSYSPIQRLIRILFDSGYQEKQDQPDMDFLEQSLCRLLEKQKELEDAYQMVLKDYTALEQDVLFRKNSFRFTAEKKRKLVNYIWTEAKVGCEEILNEIYEENHCGKLPVKNVHRLFLYVVDMVLIALDDSGIDINRLFEGQQELFDTLLAASDQETIVAAVRNVMVYISYMVNANKLDSKELLAKRAMEYMKKHYSEREFGLGPMAEELQVSPEHLSRVIKNVTGTNYVETLNQMRLEQAKVYLKTTNLNLEEIAGRVGWGGARYFIRIFKQCEGITPGKYRGSTGQQKSL